MHHISVYAVELRNLWVMPVYMNNLWHDLVVRRSVGQRKDTGSVSRLDLVVILRRSACNRKDPGSVSRLCLMVSRSAGKAVHFVVPWKKMSHAKKSSRFLQGKQAATELRYPSACCWVFLCFRNPPNSVAWTTGSLSLTYVRDH